MGQTLNKRNIVLEKIQVKWIFWKSKRRWENTVKVVCNNHVEN
jgi:hypothetical protein